MTCTCIMFQLIFLMINGNKSIIFDETKVAKGNYLSIASLYVRPRTTIGGYRPRQAQALPGLLFSRNPPTLGWALKLIVFIIKLIVFIIIIVINNK